MNLKKLLVLAIFAIAIVGIIAPLDATSIDNSVKIESKVKTASYKITWNGNGGKIGTQKIVSTTVKKGTTIEKLPKTPKRSGYTFKGWYTKKSGGTKITKNTIVKKKVNLYAKWKKGTSSSANNTGLTTRKLTAEEKKLVGTWEYWWNGNTVWTFNNDGTFIRVSDSSYGYIIRIWQAQGYYSLKNGVLTIQVQSRMKSDRDNYWNGVPWGKWEKSTYNIEFGMDNERGKEYVVLGTWGKNFKKK